MRRSSALLSVALALPALLAAQTHRREPAGAPALQCGHSHANAVARVPARHQFSGLRFRGIGPAMASGASAKWRFIRATRAPGTSRCIRAGCGRRAPVPPQEPITPTLTVWVGTGENNSQRSVGYGDGVYKSTDGGKTWKNMGLKKSEHIGKIVIDPRDSEHVSTSRPGAAVGPGGDRGLYKTTDGGKTWTQVLSPTTRTPASPTSCSTRATPTCSTPPPTSAAATWTLIDGGPRSAIYKLDRRRRHLEEAQPRAARRRTWAASAWPSRPPSPTSSTPGRGGRRQGRLLPLRRRRRTWERR